MGIFHEPKSEAMATRPLLLDLTLVFTALVIHF